MRFQPLFRGLLPASFCALAAFASCKTSSASGTAAAASDAGSVAKDIGQGAGTAAGTVAQGMENAGRAIVDAGGAAVGAVSGAAVTAADAAREAAAGAKAGAAEAMDGGTPAEADAGAPAAAASLTDPQIAAIALAANKVDIDAAQVAKKKTKNAQVRKFANDMVRDHSSANKQAAALAKKLGVTPEESDVSRALAQDGQDNLARLKPLKGKAFDRAYAEHEVTYHQQVLGALDEKLIPQASNAELKALLQSVRAVVAQHLDHASSLLDALSR